MCGKSKPRVSLVGQDGNVFNILGICTSALKRASQADKAKELKNRVFGCGSYDAALAIMMEYVDVDGPDDEDSGDDSVQDI